MASLLQEAKEQKAKVKADTFREDRDLIAALTEELGRKPTAAEMTGAREAAMIRKLEEELGHPPTEAEIVLRCASGPL